LLDAAGSGSGHFWWSSRADGADSRLTGRFDLRGVTTATLGFKLWHDLEENWDFAYFLASTDGGATWAKIPTARTTDHDPNGNNFGTGLTGRSGGWIEETLDLSKYAGNEVLVRFEVVTDDAVHLSGLAVDDLAIDAIGFADDVESESPAWQPEGFLRVPPAVRQPWAVQVIVHRAGRLLAVHRPAVGADGRTPIDVEVPDDASVTVAVSGLAPGTRHPAGYSLVTAPDPPPTAPGPSPVPGG
jgi:hypothetical protein